MSGLPPGGLNPEDWFGPQPPIKWDERMKLERDVLHEHGSVQDASYLLKKPIVKMVWYYSKARAWFIDGSGLDKAKAIRLGKRAQKALKGRRTLTADIPYMHYLDLYVGYDGGVVKLPPLMTRARTENTMDRAHEKDIIRTLVKAGHESLAKTFARSRGYRVHAGVVQSLKSLGFERWHMGGGAYALGRNTDDGNYYILATDGNLDVPNDDDAVQLGLYHADADDGELAIEDEDVEPNKAASVVKAWLRKYR